MAHVVSRGIEILLMWIIACNAAPAPGDMESTNVSEIPGFSSSGSLLPDTLDLTFGLQAGQVTLNLTRNPHVTSSAPVFLGRGGKVVEIKNLKNDNFAVYTDAENQAGFLVESVQQNGQQLRSYRGSFHVGADEFVLEPRSSQRSRRKRSANSDTLDYVVFKLEPANAVYEEDNVMRPVIAELTRHQAEIVSSGTSYPGKQIYNVEVLLVLDYAIFNQWFQGSKAYHYVDKEREALENIRHYFSHIMNGIDMRYRNIREPDFAIGVFLKALYIATTPTDSPWTESPGNKEPGPTADRAYAYASGALDAFELWLNQTKHKLPPFDQATLYTGHTLFNGRRSDGSHRTIAGLADIKGVCSYYGASINEDAGQYASMQTGAHEMGHNLGAYHDNIVYNSCVSKDQYIMATSPGQLTDSNYKNAFTFSPCSRRAFREYLMFLTMQGKNCLLDDNGNPDERTDLGILPGRRHDLNDQCKQIHGFHSYYCGGHENDQNMCRQIMCFVPELNKCRGHVEERAYDGTTCGDRKWCESGDCVLHPQAPSAADYCLTGDYLGRFYDGRHCSDVIREDPWQCYQNHHNYHSQCCKSCQDIRDPDLKDCEFGDRTPYCKNIQPWNCYQEIKRQECCGTCAKFLRDKPVTPTCIYGDKASWCATIEPRGCYHDADYCCETCPRIASTKNTDCPWGDRNSWCSGIERRECYSTAEACCSTCQPSGPPGCEYGDLDRYCHPGLCSESYGQENCCQTCGTHNFPPNTPSPKPTTTTTTTTTTSKPPTTTRKTGMGCEGDKASWCATMPTRDCYVSELNCCSTCLNKAITGAPAGCEYGDHVAWCSTYIRGAEDCNNEDIKMSCCMTCAKLLGDMEPEKPASACIDSAIWCSTMPARDCYVPSIAMTCCARCTAEKKGPTGCEYGDEFSWCSNMSPFQCLMEKENCCVSCR